MSVQSVQRLFYESVDLFQLDRWLEANIAEVQREEGPLRIQNCITRTYHPAPSEREGNGPSSMSYWLVVHTMFCEVQ